MEEKKVYVLHVNANSQEDEIWAIELTEKEYENRSNDENLQDRMETAFYDWLESGWDLRPFNQLDVAGWKELKTNQDKLNYYWEI